MGIYSEHLRSRLHARALGDAPEPARYLYEGRPTA
jgi:hypothetical protein